MRAPPGGYHGRYLRIDLTTGRTEEIPLPEPVLRRFIGGVGLGAYLLLRECRAGCDALGPESPLIVTFSPLVGTPLTTSAKFAVLAKSPLTERINDSLSSSAFAIAGKKTGFDALVIVGQAREPTTLVIEPERVRFESAVDEWGASSVAAAAQIRSRLGAGFRVASIGPAGEKQVRYATISHDSRHAARGGLGAVMGSKYLKAIAVNGDRRTGVAHPEELTEYAQRLSKLSFGPATAKYSELGTVSNLLVFNRLGVLPTRNFQDGSFAEAAALSPDTIAQSHPRVRASCAACTIGCEHIFRSSTGDGVRLEYESLFALGPLCGVSDSDAVIEAARFCDEAGIDTISAGAAVAFAMECAERGLIDEPGLRFGSAAAQLTALRRIAARDGLGDLLAEGVRVAAERIGGGSDEFAPHVKGLEIPGYEPRALQTMALGLAVGTRGADHNRSGAYQADFSDQVDRLNAGPEAVRCAIETEDEAAVMDSLILCKFLRGVFDDRYAAMAEMLGMITGWDVTTEELQSTAQRIVTAKKWFNVKQGWTPAEDTLPKRFFQTALNDGVSHGARLDEARFKRQIRDYNRQRGWSDDGWIPDELAREFDSSDIESRSP